MASRSVTKLVCLICLAFVWQRLKAGDVLEQSRRHLVELGTCQPPTELLQGNRHEATHLVIVERVM